MKIDTGVVLAFGRHLVTAVGTACAVLVGIGMMPPEQSTSTIDAVKQITHGLQEIIVGASVLVSAVMGVVAAFKASPMAQMLSVSKHPEVQAIVTSAEIANAVPSPKVVAPADIEAVVNKS